MSYQQVVVGCQSGTKWTAPLSTSSPDPCPSRQKMTAITLVLPTQSELDLLSSGGFDAVEAGGYFSFALGTVIAFWLLGKSVGAITNFLKRA